MSTYVPDLGVEEQDATERVRQPLVYSRTAPNSYYADLALARTDKAEASRAGERLEEHRRQMADLPLETREHPDASFEFRGPLNQTEGHGLEFTPPLWLNQYFATAPRPGEVIQRLAREKGHQFDMPTGAASVNLPRLTKGTQVEGQTPGGAVSNREVETEKVKAQSVVYVGDSDWSIQSLEQSPQGAHLDMVVFMDLAEALDASLEEDLISGKGEAFNRALGLLNIKGVNEIENTEIKTETMATALAKAMAAVGVERKRPPDAWLMATGRLAFISLEAEEKGQRPLVLTDNVGDEWPVVSLAGVGVYLDDAITRTFNGNQEPVFCVRSDDFLLWHSPPRTRVLTEVKSGSLGVRFELYRTTASMLHRYPSGISVITGAGMKASGKYYA